MNDLEFTFEDSTCDLLLASSCDGSLSAAKFLTLMESQPEEAVEDVLLKLESNGIILDISDLPKTVGTGEAALRLRREAELVKNGTLLAALEENDPLRLYLEELSAIPACGDPVLLAQACAEGKVTAQEQLLNVSLSRVVEMAEALVGNGVLLLDLIQEGSLGLWQAIMNFSGGDFEAYSDRWIRGAMARLITLEAAAVPAITAEPKLLMVACTTTEPTDTIDC